MSTYWDVYCVNCKVEHGFDGANHAELEMAEICKHADAIAALSAFNLEIDLHCTYGRIKPWWFAEHLGHKLVPRNEYGEFLGQCPETVKCVCGSRKRCTLPNEHGGEHCVNHENTAG